MSVSVQSTYKQSPIKQAPAFADENVTEEVLTQMRQTLNTAENLNEFLGSGSKQAKNYAQHRIQQIPQSGELSAVQSAATHTGSPLKSGTLSAKSPIVTVSIFNPLEHLDSSDEDECTFHPKINTNANLLAKRFHSVGGDTNEFLYKDAADRTMKSIEYQQLERVLADKSASASKIGTKSTKIVLKKLQQSLAKLIKDCEDDGAPDHLSFEGVGTVLNRLGVFQNLEFVSAGNDGEKSVLSINHAAVKPERLAREIQFHENIWKIFALASIELNHVPSDLVLRFIMTLVEDKTNQADSANFLLEILDAKLESLGLANEREKFMYHKLKEEKKLWSLEKLVVEFRKLFEDKTSFMNTYSSNSIIKNRLEVKKEYTNTHKPQIGKKSVALDKTHLNKSLTKKFNVAEEDIKEHKLDQRHHRLYKYHSHIKNKKSLKLEERIMEELAPCTFTPKVKSYKDFKTQITSPTDSPNKSGYFTQAYCATPPPNRHLLLYEVAKTYKEKLQQKSYSVNKKAEIEDLSLCTFKPKLNNDNKASDIRFADFYESVPNGFKKNVERLHKGDKIRVNKKLDLETIPRGENYEKNRAAEFAPPTFITRPKIGRKEVLVYVDVSIGPGRTGRIGIHKGDNAKSLALNFARTYSLNATMKESLEKLLQSYIDSYFAQANETASANASNGETKNGRVEEEDDEEEEEDDDEEEEDDDDDDEEEEEENEEKAN